MNAKRLAIACLLLLFVPRAAAMSVDVATNACVMQQPTSHYYHLCYGAEVGVASKSERIGMKLAYAERPEFNSGGFADKESLTSLRLTTKLTKAKDHGLHAGFGVGQLYGYIKSSEEFDGVSMRDYFMLGPIATIAYNIYLGNFYVRAHHETFVGYVNEQQVRTYVAWPYNFYGIKTGYRW